VGTPDRHRAAELRGTVPSVRLGLTARACGISAITNATVVMFAALLPGHCAGRIGCTPLNRGGSSAWRCSPAGVASESVGRRRSPACSARCCTV
jgi:hypothetical protein